MSKQYGLIVPGKNKPQIGAMVKRPAIFDEDSDSDKEIEKPTGLKTSLKRQDRVVQEKAVEEDPTVYQYDEIYDDMEQKRKDSKLSRKDLEKKPKYINKLLEAANRRKQDNERRIERQIQKEREAEGDEFKDKEAFVTTAYRQKLEEMKKQEEEEKHEEYLEAIGDVRKQGNLDGFYRHLYDQKVNYEDEEIKPISKKRKYRQKRDESEEEEAEAEPEQIKLEHLPSNLDADSDFSIDSESEESESEAKTKKAEAEVIPKIETESENVAADDVKQVATEEEGKDVVKPEPEQVKEPKKPKIDIWKKRTVGVVFEEALQRYYQRKALREAGSLKKL